MSQASAGTAPLTSSSSHAAAAPPTGLGSRLARRAVERVLAGLRHGRLTLQEAGRVATFGMPGTGPEVEVHVTDPRFFAVCALGGTRGAGEAYMRGWWTCDRLEDLIRLFVINSHAMRSMDSGLARLLTPIKRIALARALSTREGARRNIAHHYDLGNDFFSLFLDPTMMYSCGIFESPSATLEQASIAKVDRLCRKLALTPDDHLLEIGTGWGYFAIHAASKYGCRVTTTTISREQASCARARITAAGLEDRITVLEQDYRDLTGTYDKLVSVEMIEAVGHRFLDTYFTACSGLLKPEGMMALQAITIGDRDYDAALREADFIQTHIFPGSFIPSLGAIQGSVQRNTDLRVTHIEDIGPHYVPTLRAWRQAFMSKLDQVRAMGFDETFIRMWEFYFCYCEGAFAERYISDAQIILAKPGCRAGSILGAIP